MQQERTLRLLSVLLFPGVLGLTACQGTPPPITVAASDKVPNRTALDPEVAAAFWRVAGNEIVTGSGEAVQLRGIGFGNEAFQNTEVPSGHHKGSDFEKLAQMGANSVRFDLNYRSFEDDDVPGKYKELGWRWLDQNVDWARRYGVRLVLTMSVPAGKEALWESEEYQERFVALWRTIAERYRAEPSVAGYNLLSAPSPSQSKEQWQKLAALSVAEIREVDQHHMIFVAGVQAVAGSRSEDKEMNFVRVDDKNVVYAFGFFKPYQFTHQGFQFDKYVAQQAWYPDAKFPEVERQHLKAEIAAQSLSLPGGDSDWSSLSTLPFVVEDEKLVLGSPMLLCTFAEGRASFDSLRLTRLSAEQLELIALAEKEAKEDAEQKPKWSPKLSAKQEREKKAEEEAAAAKLEPTIVFEVDLDTQRGWSFSSDDGLGQGEFVTRGSGDFTALAISGAKEKASLTSETLRFRPKMGSEYRLSARARGEDLGQKSNCRVQLQFYSSEVPVMQRGAQFVKRELDAYLDWGKSHNLPLYLGGFGSTQSSFSAERGGEKWVQDVLAIVKEQRLNFSYQSYHDGDFGLYASPERLPREETVNKALVEVIAKALSGDASPGGTQAEAKPADGQEDQALKVESKAVAEEGAPQKEEGEASEGQSKDEKAGPTGAKPVGK